MCDTLQCVDRNDTIQLCTHQMRVHLLSVAALTVLIVHLRIHSSLKRDCGKNRGFEVDQIAVSLNEQCVVCQATEFTSDHEFSPSSAPRNHFRSPEE